MKVTFFDLETTDVITARARICSICITVYDTEELEERKVWYKLVNPTVLIPEECTKVHGITNEQVEKEQTFKEIAPQVYEFIKGEDTILAGHNIIKYDIPVLQYELRRAGIRWTPNLEKTIDTFKIMSELIPRTLAGALKFYTGKEMLNAHNAAADVMQCIDVFKGQMEYHKFNSIKGPMEISSLRNSEIVDWEGRLKYNADGDLVFNFGKHKGRLVKETLEKERGYRDWMNIEYAGSSTVEIINNLLG